MRRGFTIIELIFVIIVIGILAAVGIPKLAATRSDADGAKIANNLATCIIDAGGQYGMRHDFGDAIPKTGIYSVACSIGLKDSNEKACFTLDTDATNGTLKITNTETTQACKIAHNLAARNRTSSDLGVTHNF